LAIIYAYSIDTKTSNYFQFIGVKGVDTYRTEEEQVTAIKGFVATHGSKVLAIIIICIAIVLGVQGYMQKQSAHRSAASVQFNILTAQIDQNGGEISSEQQQIIDSSYQVLITDYADTIYAVYANFFQAKLAVSTNNLDAASNYLNWISANASNDEMLALAQLRLGQIAFAQKQYDQALTIANQTLTPFTRQFYSLQGDIYVAQGDRAKALIAYQKSKASAEAAQLAEDQILSLKIASLEPADATKLVKPTATEMTE
jgi:predicted negative regulator of RcsB-dependent stress response